MTVRRRSALVVAALIAAPVGAQEVVESQAPRDPVLTLADEPLVRIGIVDGPLEYIFGDVTSAVRLEDGSIVVADEQDSSLRKYDANGRHVWTSGRTGEGPGEYRGLRLVQDCPGAGITVFDWRLNRFTQLDLDGEAVATRRALPPGSANPYATPACSPDGRLVFRQWPDDVGVYDEAVAVGEHYRWSTNLMWREGDNLATLRSGIPGAERTRFYAEGSGPSWWGKDMVFTPVDTGVWYGTADDYELEHLDWTGRATRIARWNGPNLYVTDERVDSFREAWLNRYDDPERRGNFERDTWPDIRDNLPESFPAYEAVFALPDGGVWVKTFVWRAPEDELHLLDRDGVWVRRLTLPGNAVVLDAGPNWVLLSQRGELDAQTVALYELVER
ncbi:hypothetical protein [Candidatus Palauibacter sp.]|uniref:hypothetical protein n=1 Tax=Candidatus Palauibacter sp. TaxID=3101350 RepID=UPI003B5CC051